MAGPPPRRSIASTALKRRMRLYLTQQRFQGDRFWREAGICHGSDVTKVPNCEVEARSYGAQPQTLADGRPLLRSMLLAALAVRYVIDGGHGRR